MLTPVIATALAIAIETPYPALGVLVSPSVVHAAYGKSSHALLNPFALLGSMTAGGLLFGAPFVLGQSCTNTLGDFGCVNAIGAVALGVLVGYALWAVVDVLENGDRVERRRAY